MLLGLPVILLGIGVVLMRTDPDPETRPRTVVGALLLGLGVLGVWHLSVGAPGLLAGRQAGGGVIGAWVADPLTAGVTVWLSMPVLVLVAAFFVYRFIRRQMAVATQMNAYNRGDYHGQLVAVEGLLHFQRSFQDHQPAVQRATRNIEPLAKGVS